MTIEPQDWLSADPAQRLHLGADPAMRAQLASYLGEAAVERYATMAAAVAKRRGRRHLAAVAPAQVLFVPGVMGSLLRPTQLPGVWWIDARALKYLNDLALAPGGDADLDSRYDVQPFTLDMTYDGFFAAALERDDVDCAYFPYDWRKPLSVAAAALGDRIAALHAQLGTPIQLVAHSMGGIVVRLALAGRPELWDQVDRIVFLGTPHYGSPAIAGYLKNHFCGWEMLTILGRFLSRETFRSMWGPLSLLPAPRGVYPGTDEAVGAGDYQHPCVNFDPYDAGAWQLGLDDAPRAALQHVLTAAADQHRLLHASHGALAQELRDRMVVLAGVGYRTLFRLAYRHGLKALWKDMDKVTDRQPGDPNREGDGRVPQASAQLESIGDTRYAKAVHGSLPTTSPIYDDVFRIALGEPSQLPTSPAAALSHVLDGPSSADRGLAAQPSSAAGDDPGYLSFDDPDPASLEALVEQAANGDLLELNRTRLL